MLWKEVQSPRVKKETKPMLRGSFQWKAQGQCSKGDSCSFSHDPLLAFGNRSSDEKDDRLLLHTIQRQNRLTEKKDDKEENSDKRSQILCRF